MVSNPIYKPITPFIRGITPFRGLTNHGYYPLTIPGMILQGRAVKLQGCTKWDPILQVDFLHNGVLRTAEGSCVTKASAAGL